MKKIIIIFILTLFLGSSITVIGMEKEIKTLSYNYSNISQVYEYAKNEFIVKFKDKPRSFSFLDYLNEKYQINSMKKLFKNSENTILDNIYIFNILEEYDILSIVDEFNSLDNVEYAEPNYKTYLCGIPNDPEFNKQYSLDNTGQYGGTTDADIDAPEIWDIETGNADIIIAIIDTGVDYTHPDLAANIWINMDEIPNNDVDDDSNGYVDDYYGYDVAMHDNDPLDFDGHGTHCAGIVGAVGNNGIGISGICWNCKIMAIKIFNETNLNEESTFYSRVSQGIKYASDNDADIISMSLGWLIYSDLLQDTINYAYNKGIVIVAAAGNQNWNNELYPAACDNVIAVAATDKNDSRMNTYDYRFKTQIRSNWGDWVDVAAPGEWIYSTMPTYIVTDNIEYGLNQNYDYNTGTSMAAPHVAGLAALILSKNSTYSPDKVKSIICANVDNYDSEYYIGTGRINAYKAIIEYNIGPDKPEQPSGKNNGKPEKEYNFSTTTNDTNDDRDELYYKWDWGDGTTSEWIGPFNSGEICESTHIWKDESTFNIRVRAKDNHGALSDWSEPLRFSTPKIKNLKITTLKNISINFSLLKYILLNELNTV